MRCARRPASTARGRLTVAVDLLAEAGNWDGVLAILRDAQMMFVAPVAADELSRWSQLLPARLRQEPETLLAAGFACQEQAPLEALAIFESAATKFRAKGDIDGEMAAMGQNGLVRWWIKDFPGLFALHQRVRELAAAGSATAEVLVAVAMAGLGHLTGDSAQTLAALADVDEEAAARWLPVIHWNRSVAHRRLGDLWQARAELDATRDSSSVDSPVSWKPLICTSTGWKERSITFWPTCPTSGPATATPVATSSSAKRCWNWHARRPGWENLDRAQLRVRCR